MKNLIYAVAMIGLAGCASVSEVSKIGPDTYMVGANVHGTNMSQNDAKVATFKRANEYCASIGRVMVAQHIDSQGVQGFTPRSAELIFYCMTQEQADVAGRTRFENAPNQVIEIRNN